MPKEGVEGFRKNFYVSSLKSAGFGNSFKVCGISFGKGEHVISFLLNFIMWWIAGYIHLWNEPLLLNVSKWAECMEIQGRIQDLIRGGAQIMTGLKLLFWGLSFVEFWCWGLIFGGRGGGPPGSAPEITSHIYGIKSGDTFNTFLNLI